MVKQKKRTKHIPQRTCVGCREVLSKRELIRIVRTPEGVNHDPTGKAKGRGAYLHDKVSCWKRALKGNLASALKTDLTEDDRKRLAEIMSSLEE
ncbi:MAG TPA: YlxR family protein [Pelolinea sp.]|nr:YlxR family protein [Pelolinea sp.]